MTYSDALDEDLSRHEPRRERYPSVWREIAVGLGIATIGILMALSVVQANSAQSRTVQHASEHAAPLRHDSRATEDGVSLTPPLRSL
jgi:hypothetical protein